jgi:hypothetical protein
MTTSTDRDNVTLHMQQGADWTMVATYTNTDGSVKDLTGKSFKMGIVTNAGSTPIILLTTVNAKITVNLSLGKVTFKLPAASTILLKRTRYEYDIFSYDSVPNTDYEFGGIIDVRLARTP